MTQSRLGSNKHLILSGLKGLREKDTQYVADETIATYFGESVVVMGHTLACLNVYSAQWPFLSSCLFQHDCHGTALL